MKVKSAVIIVVLIISYGFVFSGCANLIVSGPGTIAPENTRLALPKAGQHKALLWKGKELNIQYSIMYTKNDLNITGSLVIHDDILMTFPAISQLFVKLYFLDNAGKMLGVMDINPLYSAFSQVTGPLEFHSAATVPPDTHYFAFGYYGQLIGQPYEANGKWDIFYSPFK